MKLEEIFGLFVAAESEPRLHLREPHLQRGDYYASDSYSLIRLKAGHGADWKEIDSSIVKFYNVIPEDSVDVKIKVKEIEEIIIRVDMINEVIFEYEDCDACDGEGEVDWEYYADKTYTIEADCPICDGEGQIEKETITGNKIPDPDFQFEIKDVRFTHRQLSRLIQACEMIGVQEITWTHIAEKGGNKFKVGDFDIIIMPCLKPAEA